MTKIICVAVLLALASTHSSAINKCVNSSGKVVFQDVPCAGTEQATTIKPWDQSEGPSLADVQRQKQENKSGDKRIAIRIAINERRPLMGMTPAELEQALGQPQSINTGTYPGKSTQQRVYYLGNATWYVYMDNGTVSSFQNSIR